MKTCEYCGQEFEPKKYAGNKQRFCTERCNNKWRRDNPKYEPRTCNNCGRSFVPKALDRVTFCSRECAFEHRKAKPVEKSRPVCVICGREFDSRQGRKYCSDECRKKVLRDKERKREAIKHGQTDKSFVCKQCGKLVLPEYGTKLKVFCSAYCCKKYVKKANDKKHPERKADERQRRAARLRGAKVEQIKRLQIYARDNWICQLCGKKVNKHHKYPHPMSPSIDHIIPLSQGGTHEPVNVQLAHFICNSKRSAIGPAQLRLFG